MTKGRAAEDAALWLVLPGERPVSWNKFYAGMHWRQRSQIKRDVGWAVRAAVLEAGELAPFTRPVSILIVAYCKGQQLDPDNVTAKLYIDALKHAGLFADDTPAYIDVVSTRVKKDNDHPRVEIVVREQQRDEIGGKDDA